MNSIWRLGAIADMNQDGDTDFIWQRNDGVLAVWFMAETNIFAKTNLNEGKPVAWRLLGAGDWNQDSHPDLLWRHLDGRIAVWFMDQTDRVSATLLNDGKPVASSWRFCGLADPYKRGVPSLHWQHTDGRIGLWEMRWTLDDGLERLMTSNFSEALKPAGSNWSLKGFGSFMNRPFLDGALFENSDRRVVITTLEPSSQTILLNDGKPVGAGWKLIGGYARSEN